VVSPGLTPFDAGTNTLPGSRWGTVRKEEINSGFAPVQLDQDKIVEKSRRDKETNGIAKNRFIRGTSPKITFDLNPGNLVKPLAVKVNKSKPKKPSAQVSEKQRAKFHRELRANVVETSSFILRDLVPNTMALKTAVDRSADVVKQVYNTDLNFPLDYLEKKALTAVYLRIIRHLSESFELTKDEKEIMLADLRPWVVS
jgi:hypothetical protein